MTDEERGKALLENIRRRDELLREIQNLECELKQAGVAIKLLGRALADDPSCVQPSLREHTYELPRNVTVKLNSNEVRRVVTELKEARDKLFSVNMALEPEIPCR